MKLAFYVYIPAFILVTGLQLAVEYLALHEISAEHDIAYRRRLIILETCFDVLKLALTSVLSYISLKFASQLQSMVREAVNEFG